MSVLAPVPASATGTTPLVWLRRNRALVAIGFFAVVALVLLAVTAGLGRSGALDPDSYEPDGARALATLLRDQGVPVHRTVDVPRTLSGLTEATTVFVPRPRELSTEELARLGATGARLVVAGADPPELDALAVDADAVDVVDVADREPGCSLTAAVRAGRARSGGTTYQPSLGDAQSCYGGTLVALAAGRVVLLGDGDVLSNAQLGKQGNAELGLQLLGQGSEVRWLVPDPARTPLGERKATSLNDLLPDWVVAGVAQLLVALVVGALWRARRLGRVVPEPLPVVVRAAETVEGRGRLYRAAGSRDTAAEALRGGARDRLAGRLGAGRSPTPAVLVDLVAARSARPGPDVQHLLYGPPPVDDDALVRLAHDLDVLDSDVRKVAGT